MTAHKRNLKLFTGALDIRRLAVNGFTTDDNNEITLEGSN